MEPILEQGSPDTEGQVMAKGPKDSNGHAGKQCPSCSGINEQENRYCVHCGHPIPAQKKVRRTKRILFVATLGLLLGGGVWFFARGNAESEFVGKVNGEGIIRKEFSVRVERMKKFYENRHGQALFQGESGKPNLLRLKAQTLDELIVEKILLQEAKKAGYATAPEDEVVKQLDEIKKMSGLSEPELENRMGAKVEDLKGELRDAWIISQFVEKAVLKEAPGDRELFLQQWLTDTKQKAKVELFEKLEPVSTPKASCCGTGGGCGGGGKAQPLDAEVEKEAKAKGLEYYEQKTRKKGAEAQATNFGCHIQVDITENGKVVLSLTYRQGEVQEI